MFADVPPFAFDTQTESKYMEKLERIDVKWITGTTEMVWV